MEINKNIHEYITNKPSTGKHTLIQDEDIEIMSTLPRIRVWKYADKSRSKSDPMSQDAHKVVFLSTANEKNLFISLCDGVTNAFFSEYSAQVIANTLAKYQIQSLDDLQPHIDEMQTAYGKLLMGDAYVQDRLEKNKEGKFSEHIETKAGATTLGSVKISVNAKKTGLEAKVHMVGNSAFFVIHQDGSFDTICYSEACLDSPRFCGVDLGKNTYAVYQPEDDDLWEVTETVPLAAGDTCLFTTDGMASGFLAMLKDPLDYVSKGSKLTANEARLRIADCNNNNIKSLRDTFVDKKLVPEDDVTLIKISVKDKNEVAL